MIWFVVMQVFSILLEGLSLGKKTEQEKDLEILLLRRQLAILERKQDKPLRVSRAEKLPLAVLLARRRTVRPPSCGKSSGSSNPRRSSNGIGKLSD